MQQQEDELSRGRSSDVPIIIPDHSSVVDDQHDSSEDIQHQESTGVSVIIDNSSQEENNAEEQRQHREIPEELYALRAEVYEALHKVVEYNASFHSAQDDVKRFKLMFPGNNVAEQYAFGATKATYLLTHGVCA